MPDFDRSYPIAEAERGKFVPLTQADLTTLGMTTTASRGRYALLTYLVSPVTVGISGGTFTGAIPNACEELPRSIVASSVSAVNFGTASQLIEIYNNSGSQNIYVSFNSTTWATVSARGIRIDPETYYSIEREASKVYIGADGAGSADVRIINHYKV